MKKYEMTPSQWATARKKIEQTHEESTHWNDKVLGVVELGHLVITPAKYSKDGEKLLKKAVLSTKVAVDILWSDKPLPSFKSYQVWPLPCGVHTFAGWEGTYAKEFCEANPDHEYCNPVITDDHAS
jgi:hypothetical protein